LNRLANRVARAILAQCGSQSEPIALLCAHGADAFAPLLGVLKAGKFYLPLEPWHPADYLKATLEDSHTRLLISSARHLALAQAVAPPRCAVLTLEALASDLPTTDLGLPLAPDLYAALIYTSGSTSRPKGVLQSHRTLLHRTLIDTNTLCLGPEDRWALLASYSYSFALRPIYASLLNGALLCPYDMREHGAAHLATWLQQQSITIYGSVPVVFRTLVETLTGTEGFPALRFIVLSGDIITRGDIDLYRTHFRPPCRCVVTLGANEAGLILEDIIDHHTPLPDDVMPVGYPVAETEVLLLDETGVAVAENCTGEIVVKSRYLSPGYWQQPELTQAVFHPDPAGGNARLYYTGDLGQRLPDGRIVYQGRKDFQVKIHGQHVNLESIALVLRMHPAVRDAVVVLQQDNVAEPILLAYVVPRQYPAPPVSALRQALLDKLPLYMLPSRFVWMEALPYTPNGKVDRRALPTPQMPSATAQDAVSSPQTLYEAVVLETWVNALGVPHIAPHDDFFDLGGHSLAALHILHQVDTLLNIKLSPGVFVEAPTAQQFATLLAQHHNAHVPIPSLVALQHGSRQPPFFCVPPAARTPLIFHDLVYYLGKEQSFYGMQHRGMEGLYAPDRCVKTMATHYLTAIRTVQPRGPYLLGGMCFGGMVAFEMACQLEAQGETVALLAILDLWTPYYARRNVWHQAQQYLRHGRLWLDLRHGSLWTALKHKSMESRWYPCRSGNLEVVMQAHQGAVARYRPKLYHGQITLFRTMAYAVVPEYYSAWEGLSTQPLELIPIAGEHKPGDRDSFIRAPQVQFLAERLMACIYQHSGRKAWKGAGQPSAQAI
jgi:amino acid adenylation domain-containing protein